MELAKNISIDRNGILINGKRLPYWLAVEEVEVRSSPDDIASIRLTLLADEITISPHLDQEEDGEVVLVSFPEYDEQP